jgi:hypothetical protein
VREWGRGIRGARSNLRDIGIIDGWGDEGLEGFLMGDFGSTGILYYGEILGKRTKWEEFIMLNLKFLPPF